MSAGSDGQIEAARQHARSVQDRVLADTEAALAALYWRQESVVLARLTGVKARRHTRHWDGGNPTYTTKALNVGYILDRARWAADVAETAAAAARDAVTTGLQDIATRTSTRPMPADTPAALALAARAAASIVTQADTRAAVIADIITAADRAGDTLDRIADAVTRAYRDAGAWAHADAHDILSALNGAHHLGAAWAAITRRTPTPDHDTAVTAATHLTGNHDTPLTPAAADLLNTLKGTPGLRKQWVTMHDDRVRPAHRPLHGTTAPLDQPFTVGPPTHPPTPMQYPGDTTAPIGLWIRCRCFLLFTFPDTPQYKTHPTAATTDDNDPETAYMQGLAQRMTLDTNTTNTPQTKARGPHLGAPRWRLGTPDFDPTLHPRDTEGRFVHTPDTWQPPNPFLPDPDDTDTTNWTEDTPTPPATDGDLTRFADRWIGGTPTAPWTQLQEVRGAYRTITDPHDTTWPKTDETGSVTPDSEAIFADTRTALITLTTATPPTATLYRGLHIDTERFQPGDTFTEGLASWTTSTIYAARFAKGDYQAYPNPDNPGVILVCDNAPALPLARWTTNTNTKVRQADEHLASGTYTVTAVEPDALVGATVVHVHWDGFDYDPATVTATTYTDTDGLTVNGIPKTQAAATLPPTVDTTTPTGGWATTPDFQRYAVPTPGVVATIARPHRNAPPVLTVWADGDRTEYPVDAPGASFTEVEAAAWTQLAAIYPADDPIAAYRNVTPDWTHEPLPKIPWTKGFVYEAMTYTDDRGRKMRKVLAYTRKGKQVGHIRWVDSKHPVVQMIEVIDKYQRRGIGHALLAQAARIEPNLVHDKANLTDDGAALVRGLRKRGEDPLNRAVADPDLTDFLARLVDAFDLDPAAANDLDPPNLWTRLDGDPEGPEAAIHPLRSTVPSKPLPGVPWTPDVTYRHYVSNPVPGTFVHTITANKGRTQVGVINWTTPPDDDAPQPHVAGISVVQEHRRQGIGHGLLAQAAAVQPDLVHDDDEYLSPSGRALIDGLRARGEDPLNRTVSSPFLTGLGEFLARLTAAIHIDRDEDADLEPPEQWFTGTPGSPVFAATTGTGARFPTTLHPAHDYMGTGTPDSLTLDQRLGRCYELSGKVAVFGNRPDVAHLIHGTIQGSPWLPTIGHGWVELTDGRVWEPITATLWDRADFDAYHHAVWEHTYTPDEARAHMARTMHYGPWEGTEGVVGGSDDHAAWFTERTGQRVRVRWFDWDTEEERDEPVTVDDYDPSTGTVTVTNANDWWDIDVTDVIATGDDPDTPVERRHVSAWEAATAPIMAATADAAVLAYKNPNPEPLPDDWGPDDLPNRVPRHKDLILWPGTQVHWWIGSLGSSDNGSGTVVGYAGKDVIVRPDSGDPDRVIKASYLWFNGRTRGGGKYVRYGHPTPAGFTADGRRIVPGIVIVGRGNRPMIFVTPDTVWDPWRGEHVTVTDTSKVVSSNAAVPTGTQTTIAHLNEGDTFTYLMAAGKGRLVTATVTSIREINEQIEVEYTTTDRKRGVHSVNKDTPVWLVASAPAPEPEPDTPPADPVPDDVLAAAVAEADAALADTPLGMVRLPLSDDTQIEALTNDLTKARKLVAYWDAVIDGVDPPDDPYTRGRYSNDPAKKLAEARQWEQNTLDRIADRTDWLRDNGYIDADGMLRPQPAIDRDLADPFPSRGLRGQVDTVKRLGALLERDAQARRAAHWAGRDDSPDALAARLETLDAEQAEAAAAWQESLTQARAAEYKKRTGFDYDDPDPRPGITSQEFAEWRERRRTRVDVDTWMPDRLTPQQREARIRLTDLDAAIVKAAADKRLAEREDAYVLSDARLAALQRVRPMGLPQPVDSVFTIPTQTLKDRGIGRRGLVKATEVAPGQVVRWSMTGDADSGPDDVGWWRVVAVEKVPPPDDPDLAAKYPPDPGVRSVTLALAGDESETLTRIFQPDESMILYGWTALGKREVYPGDWVMLNGTPVEVTRMDPDGAAWATVAGRDIRLPSDVMPVVGEVDLPWATAAPPDPVLTAAITEAARFYPTDWWDTAVNTHPHGPFTLGWAETTGNFVDRGFYQHGSVWLSTETTPAWDTQPKSARVAVHEVGHLMEDHVAGVTAAEFTEHTTRTTRLKKNGNPVVVKGRTQRGGKNTLRRWGSRGDEWVRDDKYPNAYSGKSYGERPDSMYELFTTTMESLFAGSGYADDDMAALALGLLAALPGQPSGDAHQPVIGQSPSLPDARYPNGSVLPGGETVVASFRGAAPAFREASRLQAAAPRGHHYGVLGVGGVHYVVRDPLPEVTEAAPATTRARLAPDTDTDVDTWVGRQVDTQLDAFAHLLGWTDEERESYRAELTGDQPRPKKVAVTPDGVEVRAWTTVSAENLARAQAAARAVHDWDPAPHPELLVNVKRLDPGVRAQAALGGYMIDVDPSTLGTDAGWFTPANLMEYAADADYTTYAIAHEYGHTRDTRTVEERAKDRAAFYSVASGAAKARYEALSAYARQTWDAGVAKARQGDEAVGIGATDEAWADCYAEWFLSRGQSTNPAVVYFARKYGWPGAGTERAEGTDTPEAVAALGTPREAIGGVLVDTSDLAPAYGTTPIPDGAVRINHYTTPAAVPAIDAEGLRRVAAEAEFDRGGTESPVIFANAGDPDRDTLTNVPVVEGYAFPDQLDIGSDWEPADLEERRSTVTLRGDLPREQIVAIHTPEQEWVRRLLAEGYGPGIVRGEHDNLIGDPYEPVMGAAIQWIKDHAVLPVASLAEPEDPDAWLAPYEADQRRILTATDMTYPQLVNAESTLMAQLERLESAPATRDTQLDEQAAEIRLRIVRDLIAEKKPRTIIPEEA